MKISEKRVLLKLDPDLKHPALKAVEDKLRACVIGQDRAIRAIAAMYQTFRSGMNDPARPLGTMLFLGPTGSGKTRIVEATAEALFNNPKALIKIDCAEFQHSHEISKLIGSPPGYLGHRETSPLLTQEKLNQYHTTANPITLVLFDEIEKASDALWKLLLGVLDKATLTLGDNTRVDFSRAMIFMTSNLGAREMNELISVSIGFTPGGGAHLEPDSFDQKIYRLASEAARRKFSPEFMNRIDKIVVFRKLGQEELYQIIDLELSLLQRRIEISTGPHFKFTLSECAKQFLLAEGADQRYNARHLKRSIERFLVYPFASLVSSGQVNEDSLVFVDLDKNSCELVFYNSACKPDQKEQAWLPPSPQDSTQNIVAA